MKKLIIFLAVLLLFTSCKQEEPVKQLDEPSMYTAQFMENSVEENSGTEENSKKPQTFHADPKDFYEELFYEELGKSIPHKEGTVNLIVPITTDTISNGTVTRYFSYAYWGQFSLEDFWLVEGKSALAPYEMIVIQDKKNYQTVLDTIQWSESKSNEKNDMSAHFDTEQLLKEKLKNSLSEDKLNLALEFMLTNTEHPHNFLQKIYPRTNDKLASEIQPKIQTVIEQYIKTNGLSIDGYTCLSEKRFREQLKQ